MDPKNLSQLDPKLREAYERVMGTGSAPTSSSQPADPKPVDPPQQSSAPVAAQPQDIQPSDPSMPSSQDHLAPPQQPNPLEPIPTVGTAPNSQPSQVAEASPSVFGVDVPPPPPPPPSAQMTPVDPPTDPAPVEAPPPPPPPPAVAGNDPDTASAPEPDSGMHVNPAHSPNKIMPILVVVALLVFLIVWAFFWVQLLL